MGGIVSQPKVTVNIIPATQAVENTAQKILVVGQKTAAGSAVAGQLVENILNDNSENTFFGPRSMLAAMVRNAKNQNEITQMDAIPLDDFTPGAAAFTSLWILGQASESGELIFNIASKKNHSYRVGVSQLDDAEAIADALVALINADPYFPMAASVQGIPPIGSLFGGVEVDDTIATWNAITDGEFHIAIDGVAEDITALDFSLDLDMDDVAITIEDGLNVPLDPVYSGTTVFWAPVLKQFQIFAAGAVIGTVDFTTDVTAGVGTTISALMKTDQAQAFSNQPSYGVDFDAVNSGTYGNDFSYSIEGNVAGVKAEFDPFLDGAGDPVTTGLFDVVGDKRYQTIIWPYADNLTDLQSFLDPRFNADNIVLDGIGITAKQDSLATFLADLAALNDQSLTIIADKAEVDGLGITTFFGSSQLEISAVKASEFGAIRALRLTDGASISQFVITTNGPLDSFGGPALASKPYFNTGTPDLPLIPTGKGWGENEIEQLHDAGGTVLGQNTAGNAAIVGEVVTTYKNDLAGNPDQSFKYMNYVDTASNSREYFFNNLKSRFAQSRLTEGDVLPGRDMANDLTIINYCEKLYQDLAGPEFVLLQAGEDALEFFKRNINVTLDLAQGRATVQMIVPIVTQLREILVTMKIAFSTQG